MNRILLFLIISSLLVSQTIQIELLEDLQDQLYDILQTTELGQMFKQYSKSHILEQAHPYIQSYLKNSKEYLQSSILDKAKCEACKLAMKGIDEVIMSNLGTDILEKISILVCKKGSDLNATVCDSIVPMMAQFVLPSLTNFLLSPDYICNNIEPYCNEVEYTVLNDTEYVERLLQEKPQFIQNNDYLQQLYSKINKTQGRKIIKAVHFSDMHLDFQYKAGTNANCNMPICCREENGYTSNPQDQAGEWGHYLCDPPLKLTTSMFNKIQDEIKPDLAFWTGDMTPHDVWENTQEEVMEYQYNVSLQMQSIFNFMLYPILGNHDTWPVNVQSFDTQCEVTQNLTGIWDYWLNKQSLLTFKKGGYYAQYMETKSKKYNNTRIIGLNTQACNKQNWYLWETLQDPGNQIQWLESILMDMEKKDEQGIILAHIPSCLETWSRRFQALIDRYQHIIRFGLYGHSHEEKFFLTRSVDLDGNYSNTKPLIFNSIMGSSTTHSNKNPSFAVYEIDEETMALLNITTYYFNLTKANNGEPAWELYHNILDVYNITDASPQSFQEYAERLKESEDIAVNNAIWKNKGAPGYSTSCDTTCRKNMYCDLVNQLDYQKNECKGKENTLSEKREFDLLGFSYESMCDPWIQQIKLK